MLRKRKGGLIFLLLSFSLGVLAQGAENADQKVSPHLLTSDVISSVLILVDDSVKARQWINTNLPDARVRNRAGNTLLVYNLHAGDWRKLKNLSCVRFVETAERKPKPERELSAIDFSVDAVEAAHHYFPDVTGGGIVVSIKENPFDKNDIDYSGRILVRDQLPDQFDEHATIMATIIAGAGNTSPDARGVAWKSSIAFSDFNDLLPDSEGSLRQIGVSVQNHSYGVGVESYYGIEAYSYDELANAYPELINVFSSGNAGTSKSDDGIYSGVTGFANITGEFKMSKNSLSVGAVDKFNVVEELSSRGPAHDGRLKPEVVAFGDGGSSEAAAIVSGLSALIQDKYKKQYDSLPPASLIKAFVINTAIDKGRPGPDYEYGYGIVNAKDALTQIEQGNFFIQSIGDEEEIAFEITLENAASLLSATLVWNDLPADPGTAKALVNDLDLVIEHGGLVHYPFVLSSFPHSDSLKQIAVRKPDHLNNVEQVQLKNPAPGSYRLRVTGTHTKQTQTFSLVCFIQDKFEWKFPFSSTPVVAGSQEIIRWKWNGDNTDAAISWRIADSDWQFISEVPAVNEFFEWDVPIENSQVQLKIQIEGVEYLSDYFVVAQQPTLNIGYNCESEVLVWWNKLGTSSYRIEMLKGDFMESIRSTTDTTFLLAPNKGGGLLAVTPLIGDLAGVKSRSVNYNDPSAGCFIKSFLPRAFVSDSVLFDVTLGWVDGVKQFSFERKTESGFIPVYESSDLKYIYALHDPDPNKGMNVYRIKITLENGTEIYSDEEDVMFISDDDLYFFPNPIIGDQEMNIIIKGDVAEFILYGPTGSFIRQVKSDGQVKSIDISGIPSGLYLVKGVSNNKTELVGKIVIH